MDQIQTRDPEKADAVRQLWEAYADILKKRRYDLDQLVRDWAQNQRTKLSLPGAQTDFDELTASGCVAQILAALLALLKWSPKMQDFWTQTYGNPKNRKRVIRSLERAASELEQLWSFTTDPENEKAEAQFAEIGRIAPSRLIPELRLYASMLDFLNRLPSESKTRSLKEFAKFVLTDYVKATTGDFRDRNVSGLVGEVIGPPDYNEVAHRMWRKRNFARLKDNYSRLSDLLSEIGHVLTSRA